MEVGKLTVQVRSGKGKGVARKLRAQELVPGVCYGHNVETPLPISLSPRLLKGALDPEKRHNTVIDVTVEDNGTAAHQLTVMLKDYQVHPISRNVLHVDLVAIDTEAKVEVEVPIVLTGKFVGAVLGGQLHVVRHELRLSCRPQDIPSQVELDITNLDIGDVLHISDLKIQEGIEILDAPKLTIVTCTAPAAEEEVAAEEEGAEGAAAPAADDKDKKEGETAEKKEEKK